MSSRQAAIRRARQLAWGWRWRLLHTIGTPVPADFDEVLAATFKRVRRHTLTSPERIAALCDSIAYVAREGIEGEIAECGVWKGGSMMAAAITLLRLGEEARELHLFDTFEGMPEPGEQDANSPYDGYSLHDRWARIRARDGQWAGVGVDSVRAALESTGYAASKIHCVKGMVEETIPAKAPQQIALLRLDTDWYASTRHELQQLFPRLAVGGVLIIDDYGHYEGARRAVDEYFSETGQRILLNRIDYTGRVGVKSEPTPAAA